MKRSQVLRPTAKDRKTETIKFIKIKKKIAKKEICHEKVDVTTTQPMAIKCNW